MKEKNEKKFFNKCHLLGIITSLEWLVFFINLMWIQMYLNVKASAFFAKLETLSYKRINSYWSLKYRYSVATV